jgi:RNA polymerase sigma-70 factor (ECF subfamily)
VPRAEGPDPSAASVHLDEAVARAREGDGAAFDEIYRALAAPVYSYLTTQVRRREDAEDLTGQVFLEAMRGVRAFSGDGSGFRAWLFRIAHNRAVDLARRLARRPEATLEEADRFADPVATDERAIAGIEGEALWRAVESLPEQQRRVLALRLAGGLTSREIAEILGKRLGTVKALQHRALIAVARTLRGGSNATEEDPSAL